MTETFDGARTARLSTRTSLDFRARAYPTVLALRHKPGWGYERISKYVGLPPSTVYNWIVRKHSPFGSFSAPNLSSSPPLSYVAGSLLGDGALIRSAGYHYELRLRVKDSEFAERVCACLSSVLGKPKKVKVDRTKFYVVRAWSRLLYEYLSSPDSFRQTAGQFPVEFVRGFADAEGSADISVGGTRVPTLGFYIVLVNTNLELLRYLKHLLWEKLRIRSCILLGKKREHMWSKVVCYYLKIGRREDQLRFARDIGFSIGRKQLKMVTALSLLAYGPTRAALEWRTMFKKCGRIWTRKGLTTGDGAPAEI